MRFEALDLRAPNQLDADYKGTSSEQGVPNWARRRATAGTVMHIDPRAEMRGTDLTWTLHASCATKSASVNGTC
jgi:hypothetical protein